MYCTVQSPTPNIKESIDFYTKLGFNKLGDGETNVFSDGKLIIEIDENRMARTGMRVYKDSWSDEIASLLKDFQVINKDNYSLITAPGNFWIYLVSGKCSYVITNPDETSLLGNYAGVSIETAETLRLSQILSIIGFDIEHGKAGDAWFTMNNASGFSVSVMAPNNCPHLFASPSLTYFNNKKNPEIIKAIRETGIKPWEEISVFNPEGKVDNISLRDPGGLGFFIFND